MKKNNILVGILYMFILVVTMYSAMAVQFNQNYSFNRNKSTFDYVDWLWLKEDAYNPQAGVFNEIPQVPKEDFYTISQDNIDNQYQNSIGNLTKQIGSSSSLHKRRKEEVLLKINKMWDYVIILILMIFEIIKIIFWATILYSLLFVFFVGMPSFLVWIKNSTIKMAEIRTSRGKKDVP